jgi:hypothetical protein
LSSPTPDHPGSRAAGPAFAWRKLALPPGLLAAALTALLVLSACGHRLAEGPLGSRPENHTVAGEPVLLGGADTIGLDVVYNGGTAPAVISRLVLVSPRHIKLIGAYLTIGGPIGNWVTFPPVFPASDWNDVYPIRWWADRHKPAGAVIPPHRWAGIALGLAVTGAARGSFAATDLFYSVGAAQYKWQSHIRIVLTRVDCHGPQIGVGKRAFCRLTAAARDHR